MNITLHNTMDTTLSIMKKNFENTLGNTLNNTTNNISNNEINNIMNNTIHNATTSIVNNAKHITMSSTIEYLHMNRSTAYSDETYNQESVMFDMHLNSISRNPILATLGAIGVLANALVLLVLIRGSKQLPSLLRKLLIHQSLIDGIICLFVPVHAYASFTSSVYELDVFLCYTMKNQLFLWVAAFISVQGLVCLAGERFLAICKPFTYIQWRDSSRLFAFLLLCLYLYGMGPSVLLMLLTRYHNGTCQTWIDTDETSHVINSMFTYIWCPTYYIIPVLMLTILYSKILNALRRSKSLPKSSNDNTIDRASTQLTKTAFTVTVLFIILIGVDAMANVLKVFGVIDYDRNVLFVVLCVTTLNSIVNPFVYVILMPFFRRNLRRALFCCEVRRSDISIPALDCGKHQTRFS